MNNIEYLEKFKKQLRNGVFPDYVKHYKHPLGFYFFLLEENGFGSIRLHIWPENKSEREPLTPNFPIHDHQWSFESYVICGSIKNIIYNNIPNNSGKYAEYKIEYFGDKSGAKITKQSQKHNLIIISESTYFSCEKYSMNAGEIHQSNPEVSFTATLLFTSLNDNRAPIVFGDPSGESQYLLNRTNFSNDDLATKYLKELSKKISI